MSNYELTGEYRSYSLQRHGWRNDWLQLRSMVNGNFEGYFYNYRNEEFYSRGFISGTTYFIERIQEAINERLH